MATIKLRRAAAAGASLPYGEMAIGANELYFGNSSNVPVKMSKDGHTHTIANIIDLQIATVDKDGLMSHIDKGKLDSHEYSLDLDGESSVPGINFSTKPMLGEVSIITESINPDPPLNVELPADPDKDIPSRQLNILKNISVSYSGEYNEKTMIWLYVEKRSNNGNRKYVHVDNLTGASLNKSLFGGKFLHSTNLENMYNPEEVMHDIMVEAGIDGSQLESIVEEKLTTSIHVATEAGHRSGGRPDLVKLKVMDPESIFALLISQNSYSVDKYPLLNIGFRAVVIEDSGYIRQGPLTKVRLTFGRTTLDRALIIKTNN